MKLFKYITIVLLLSSCATKNVEFVGDRFVAEEFKCSEAMKKIINNNEDFNVSEEDLNKVLKERKLISFTDKVVIFNSPQANWLLETKKSIITRIKNWNRNKYPLFYLDNSIDVIPLAKSYSDLLTKEANGNLDDEAKQSLEIIRSWIGTYQNYQKDLDNLLDERITLQYNLRLLKEVKLAKNETRDLKLTIKKGGEFVSEVVTLRDEDKNLTLILKNYKDRIRELDGAVDDVGSIKERVLKQAMAKDILTIFQRELEYSVKNTSNAGMELTTHLDELNSLIKAVEFEPSSYGVHKISNEVFKKELGNLFSFKRKTENVTNQNQVYIRRVIESFFGTKAEIAKINPVEIAKSVADQVKASTQAATKEDLKREGPLKRIYAKIATFSPYQKIMATSKLAIVGYGAYRYFIINSAPPKIVDVTTDLGEITPDQQAHQTQLDNTNKISQEESDGNSSVVEIHLENLIKNSDKKVN